MALHRSRGVRGPAAIVRRHRAEERATPQYRRLAWSEETPPSPSMVAARLREEGVEPHQWSNGPGDRYGTHEHGYIKVLMCAAGSITFLVGADAEALRLRAGDGFELPAGTPHSAVVGPEGCTCLEGSR